LKEQSNCEVTIIEAMSYAGGRVKVQQIGGKKYGVGARFVHGNKNNPVFDLFKEKGWEIKEM
jgi:monoamine oxidase